MYINDINGKVKLKNFTQKVKGKHGKTRKPDSLKKKIGMDMVGRSGK
ncbi:hypothetical protein FM106_12595 [Brachybacterium faecium]|nr:hypothetical protein FM106_12595 [Brachybacterium faecium]